MRLSYDIRLVNTSTLQEIKHLLPSILRATAEELTTAMPPITKLTPAYPCILTLSLISGKDIARDDLTGNTIPRTTLPADPLKLPATARRPKTAAKAALWDWLYSHGWQPSQAFPDFLAVHAKSSRIALIVAAKSRGRKPKRQQQAVINLLSACGVPCFSWSPDSGFSRLGLSTPATDSSTLQLPDSIPGNRPGQPLDPLNPAQKGSQTQLQTEDKDGPCLSVSTESEEDTW
jgi:hypothetical protein